MIGFLFRRNFIGHRIVLQIAWQGIVALSELHLCGSAEGTHVLRISCPRIVALS